MRWYKLSEKHPPVDKKFHMSDPIIVCINGSELNKDIPPVVATGYYTECPDGSYGRLVANDYSTCNITHWAYIHLPKDL